MANSNLAYDLERFERTAPVIVQSSKKKQQVKEGVSPIKIVFLAVLFIAITSTVLYGRVTLSELNSGINQAEGDLEILKSEEVRLQSEIENRMSLSEVERTAVAQYGMVKPDSSQVTYIEIHRQNRAESSVVQKNWWDSVIEIIEKIFNL